MANTAYMIDSGTVELVKFTGDKHTVLAELEKGALFGEMAIIDRAAQERICSRQNRMCFKGYFRRAA